MLLALWGCQAPGGSEHMIPGGQASNAQREASDAAQRQPGGALAGDRQETARLRTELAFNYFQRGQMAIALEEVRSALAADPNYATAYNVLGLINMDLGENARAEEAFRRALSIAPGDSDALNNYGWFLCQTKRERQGIEQFLLALKNPLYPTPDKPYLNAGICSQRLGNEALAEEYYRKAFTLDPLNAGAMMRLGDLYFRRDELDKARFYVDRVNKNFEPSAESLWLALRIERKAGDRVAESSFATQLRRRYPNSQEFMLLQQGRFE
ncbi:MAG: type IV pilus biogenesis/stability protein PilW [Burkholderiales bacterium]|nr:type IV pilus biogenesis/stability protein PilW [Burkholderiales bacterium]